jgi:hypothetical protein
MGVVAVALEGRLLSAGDAPLVEDLVDQRVADELSDA